MMTLDEEIKREEEEADCCEYDASKLDLYDRYENFLAGEYGKCAEECRQRAKWLKQLQEIQKIIKEYRNTPVEVMDVLDAFNMVCDVVDEREG